MLLRYNVQNFRSIGHNVEFSMIPTADNNDKRFLKTIKTKAGDWEVLHRGGFFGPNASGKTSFIKSIAFAKDFIIEGQKTGKRIDVNQFKGDFQELSGISSFQFIFYIGEEVYDYGFTLDRKQVHEEWLLILTKSGFVPMFTRATDENYKTDIEIKSKLANNGSKDRMLAEVLKEGIQESQKNQLFLYKLYDNGIKKVKKVVEWFRGIQVIFPNTKLHGLPIRMQEDLSFKDFIADKLRNLDTGVYDISVINDEIDFKELANKLDLPKNIIDDIEEIRNGIVNLNGKYFIFSENKQKKTIAIQIKFSHKLNSIDAHFDIDEESDGTQRLLDLLPILFAMDKKNTSIYFVDEIDRSLHTKLSQYLLHEFACQCGSTYNQIVFTAHDVNLINLENFTQGEIWFVEKNKFGETRIKPLSDFNIKDSQSTIKAYLNGRFGAIPVIRREF